MGVGLGFCTLNTLDKSTSPSPQAQLRERPPGSSPGDHDDPSGAPPADEVREQHEDKPPSAGGHGVTQPSPRPSWQGHGSQDHPWAESQELEFWKLPG